VRCRAAAQQRHHRLRTKLAKSPAARPEEAWSLRDWQRIAKTRAPLLCCSWRGLIVFTDDTLLKVPYSDHRNENQENKTPAAKHVRGVALSKDAERRDVPPGFQAAPVIHWGIRKSKCTPIRAHSSLSETDLYCILLKAHISMLACG
jgi:hypothetical protein